MRFQDAMLFAAKDASLGIAEKDVLQAYGMSKMTVYDE